MRKIYTLLFSFIAVTAMLVAGYRYFFAGGTPFCQRTMTCYVKASKDNALLQKAKRLVQAGNYKTEAHFIRSKYMFSKLDTYISKEDMQRFVHNAALQNNFSNGVVIRDTVYENDKRSPDKKSASCRLLTGYVLFEFLLEDEEVYKMQVEFMDEDKKEIEAAVKCIFASFFAA